MRTLPLMCLSLWMALLLAFEAQGSPAGDSCPLGCACFYDRCYSCAENYGWSDPDDDGVGDCTYCGTGKTAPAGQNTCECSSGMWDNHGACEACPDGCDGDVCDDTTGKCSACKANYEWTYVGDTGLGDCTPCLGETSSLGGTSKCVCPESEFISNVTTGECSPCDPGCEGPCQDVTGYCINCKEDFGWNEVESEPILLGTCSNCTISGMVSTGMQDMCDCPGSTFLNSNGSCQSCPSGCMGECKNGGQCEMCLANHGWFPSAMDEMYGHCEPCNSGYAAAAGNEICEKVPIVCNGVTCDVNAQCSANGMTCLCNKGYMGDGTTCTACEPGWFQQSVGKNYCVGCYPGYYSNDTASTHCTKCPPGSIANGRGAVECKTCTPWQTAGRQVCHPNRCSSRCAAWTKCTAKDVCAECSDGWMGTNCETPCPDGYHGSNCDVEYTEKYHIRGQVDAEDGSALEGVLVTINSQSLSTMTDAEGRYVINDILIPASQRIEVSALKPGYQEQVKTEKFTSVINPRLYFRLKPTSGG